MENAVDIVGKARASTSASIIAIPDKAVISAAAAPESFRVQFNSWNDNHVHWEAPSHFIMYTTGSWYFFAAHLANMRRDNPVFDQGAPVHFKLDALYYDGPLDAAGNVTGVVLHSIEYYFAGLSYKMESNNYQITGNDPTLAKLLGEGRIKSVTTRQKWTL